MDLHQKKCIPCESGGIPLTEEETKKILGKTPNWKLKGKNRTRICFQELYRGYEICKQGWRYCRI